VSAADWRSGGPWRAGDDGPADRDRPDDYEPPSRRRRVDPMPSCDAGTGWTYCAHAEDHLTVCHCSCKCLEQSHCPLVST